MGSARPTNGGGKVHLSLKIAGKNFLPTCPPWAATVMGAGPGICQRLLTLTARLRTLNPGGLLQVFACGLPQLVNAMGDAESRVVDVGGSEQRTEAETHGGVQTLRAQVHRGQDGRRQE